MRNVWPRDALCYFLICAMAHATPIYAADNPYAESDQLELRRGATITQGDRWYAVNAFQLAGEQRGRIFSWRNPTTGNSGTIVVYDDWKANDTFYHGRFVPCFRGTMTLRTAVGVDTQRQIICKLPHNGVWTTVQVEAE